MRRRRKHEVTKSTKDHEDGEGIEGDDVTGLEKKPFATKRQFGCLGIGCLGGLLLFILFCSGLNFPVLGKQASLERGLRTDFGVTPPSSLRVVNAARHAYRDPAYLYECDVSAAEGEAFLKSLEGAGRARGYDVGTERIGSLAGAGLRPPTWFNPESIPDAVKLGVWIPKEATGYWIYFSPSHGKLYVVWFAT